jgi:hypothetical protein
MSERDHRQAEVADWCAAAFGTHHASSLPQRGLRLAEEALEAYQSAGGTRDLAHRLVDYIFDRPADPLERELGGVGITLLALAAAAGLSAEGAEISELARIKAKPLAHFAARNEAKNKAGFNVAEPASPVSPSTASPSTASQEQDKQAPTRSHGAEPDDVLQLRAQKAAYVASGIYDDAHVEGIWAAERGLLRRQLIDAGQQPVA